MRLLIFTFVLPGQQDVVVMIKWAWHCDCNCKLLLRNDNKWTYL